MLKGSNVHWLARIKLFDCRLKGWAMKNGKYPLREDEVAIENPVCLLSVWQLCRNEIEQHMIGLLQSSGTIEVVDGEKTIEVGLCRLDAS